MMLKEWLRITRLSIVRAIRERLSIKHLCTKKIDQFDSTTNRPGGYLSETIIGSIILVLFVMWILMSLYTLVVAYKSPVSEINGFWRSMWWSICRCAIASLLFCAIPGIVLATCFKAHHIISNLRIRVNFLIYHHFGLGKILTKAHKRSLAESENYAHLFTTLIGIVTVIAIVFMVIFAIIYAFLKPDYFKIYCLIISLLILLPAEIIGIVIGGKWQLNIVSFLRQSRISRQNIRKYTLLEMLTGGLGMVQGIIIILVSVYMTYSSIVFLLPHLYKWEISPLLALANERLQTNPQKVIEMMKQDISSLLIGKVVIMVVLITLTIYLALIVVPAIRVLNRRFWYVLVLGLGALFSWGGAELLSRWVARPWGAFLGLALAAFLTITMDCFLGLVELLSWRLSDKQMKR